MKKQRKEKINKWWKEKVMKSDAFVLPEKHQRPQWDYETETKPNNL